MVGEGGTAGDSPYLFSMAEAKASSTACRKLSSVAGLAGILPFDVPPPVLVAPRYLSLCASSQSEARSSFLGKNRSVTEDLIPSASRSGLFVADPELDEKSFLALSHFFMCSRVVGSLRVRVWVRVIGVLDWGESNGGYSVDDEETPPDVGAIECVELGEETCIRGLWKATCRGQH